MGNDKAEKPKKIIGTRVRVGIGDNIEFEDDDATVIGQDTTLRVSKEEAKNADVVGMKVEVAVGSVFSSVYREIDQKEEIATETKEDLKAKVRELENELSKQQRDKGRIEQIWAWLKNNASWIVPIIVGVLSKNK